MSKEILVDVGVAGSLHGLHFEEFSLTKFGAARIRRATDIKFNEQTQLWDIKLLDEDENVIPHHPDHLQGFDSYEVARTHEVCFLQGCRIQEIHVVSEASDILGQTLRAAG